MNRLLTQYEVKAARLQGLRRITSGIVCLAAMAAIAGCATLGPKGPQEVVKQRAQERWDLLVKGEIRKAYEYFSPGTKAVLDVDGFVSSIRVGFWKSARVEKVECATADSCDAHITIEYAVGGTPVKSPLRETWVREGSGWWLVRK